MNAVRAAVHDPASNTADGAPAPKRTRFHEREVSVTPVGEQILSSEQRKRGLSSADAGEATNSMHCRSAALQRPDSKPSAAVQPAASGAFSPGARGGIPPMESVLARATRLVCDLESGLDRTDFLLKKSRTQSLTPDQWAELSGLISSLSENIPKLRSRCDDWLGQAQANGASNPSDAKGLTALRCRLEAAGDRFLSDTTRREESIRQIQTVLPGSRGTPVVVECRTIPGAVLRARFTDAVPAIEAPGADRFERYRQASGLAQTRIIDADGRTLYSGLCHRLFNDSPVDLNSLVGAPREELERLVDTVYFSEGPPPRRFDDVLERWHRLKLSFPEEPCLIERTKSFKESGLREDLGRKAVVEAIAKEVSLGSTVGKKYVSTMVKLGRRRMALDLVAALLAGDPDRLQSALDAGTVDLDLFDIQTLRRHGSGSWGRYENPFCELYPGRPTTLHLHNQDGSTSAIPANIRLHRFTLVAPQVDHQFPTILHYSPFTATSYLCGPPHPSEPGGLAMYRVSTLRSRASGLQDEIAAARWRFTQRNPMRHSDDPQALTEQHHLTGLIREQQRLYRTAEALERLTNEFQPLVSRQDALVYRADDEAAWVARLALFAHLLGGIPLLGCKLDKDKLNEIDAEISFLATVAAHHDGPLPPLAPDSGEWLSARADFRLNTSSP